MRLATTKWVDWVPEASAEIAADLEPTRRWMEEAEQELLAAFSPEAIALAGVDEPLVAVTDRIDQLREDEVERPSAPRLSRREVEGRRLCPPHLYERLYGE